MPEHDEWDMSHSFIKRWKGLTVKGGSVVRKEAIAFRIGQLCADRHITPYNLAILCGVDKTTVYSILGDKSKSPEVATIKKICDGLEITLGAFFSTAEFDTLEQEIQ